MADPGRYFLDAFNASVEQRRLREQLGAEIAERQAKRARDAYEFDATLGQREAEFEALQEHRAAQEARAQEELTLRQAGIGLQAEGLDIQRETLGQRREEAAALERYRAGQTELEQKRVEIEKRQSDITLATTMLKAFDPSVPKAGRKFLLSNMAKHLGIDPKSPNYKDLEGMVMGLEDESLAALKTSIGAMLPKSQPGEVAAFATAIMSGKMTLDQLTKAMGELAVQRNRETVSGSGVDQNLIKPSDGGMPTGSMKQPADSTSVDQAPEDKESVIADHRRQAVEFARMGMHEDARVQLQIAREIEMGKEFDPETRGKIKAEEKQAELEAAKAQPLPASTRRLLGLQDTKITNGEAADLGISVDLLDPAEQKDMFKKKAKTHTAIKNIYELADIVEGRPELLGSAGAIVRSIESILQQVSAIPALSQAVMDGDLGAFKSAGEVNGILRRGLAGESAVVRSRVLDLSYEIAQARESGRLSDQDVQRALAGIGDSGSPEQFTAVLTDLAERLREGTAADIESITGFRPLDLMTMDQLLTYAEESDNAAILRSVLREVNKRGK